MKKTKRMLSVLLVIILTVTISVIPVSAAGYPWTSYFAQFRELRLGCRNTYAGFTIPLQTFLECYDPSWNIRIEEAGGRDGWYGDTTATCLGEYQEAKGLYSNNICESSTWARIAGDMDEDTYTRVVIFSYDDCYIINATNSFPIDFRYYYYVGGNTYLSSPFYTATNTV